MKSQEAVDAFSYLAGEKLAPSRQHQHSAEQVTSRSVLQTGISNLPPILRVANRVTVRLLQITLYVCVKPSRLDDVMLSVKSQWISLSPPPCAETRLARVQTVTIRSGYLLDELPIASRANVKHAVEFKQTNEAFEAGVKHHVLGGFRYEREQTA